MALVSRTLSPWPFRSTNFLQAVACNRRKNRPLCQMIFVEEPEVHLHAQVQQTFNQANVEGTYPRCGRNGAEPRPPTHRHEPISSHVLDAVDFSKNSLPSAARFG